MKRIATVLMLAMISLLFSCQQPTLLSVSQTALTFENAGGNQSVTLAANKVWTASSNQGWLRVSPSSGEGNATLSISCEGNTTYDNRTGNITIVSEELTQTISVTQAEGQGLLVSQVEYNLSNEAQTISVEVKANVQYTVSIDDACKSWIKQESTKGLSSNTIKFAISKNENYDGREGKITIKQTDGSLTETITVRQQQSDGLFIEGEKEYNVSYEEHSIDVLIKSNVDFTVQIDDSCKDWISQVGTKGLGDRHITLHINENDGKARKGRVWVKSETLQDGIVITQEEAEYVVFADKNFKSYCISNFDYNNDGEIAPIEARKVEKIEVFTDNISSLKGIEYFSNITYLSCSPDANTQTWYPDGRIEYGKDGVKVEGLLTSLDVSKNHKLTEVYCNANRLNEIILSDSVQRLFCSCNGLSEFNIASYPNLKYLNCEYNNLESLDLSNSVSLLELHCPSNHLSSLNTVSNSSLQVLNCNRNKITSLDIRNNAELRRLYCGYNQITSLDVSNNPKIEEIGCGNNLLTSIDVSTCPVLSILGCGENPINSLDVSKNTELTELYCSGINLSVLDVSNNTKLISLNCGTNNLTELDISKNTALRLLWCRENQLTTLDVSNNLELVWIMCYANQLSSIDISKNVALDELHCSSNNLTSLDVTNNKALKSLICSSNKIESLNVGTNTSMQTLWCDSNSLSFLDVSGCTSLTSLHCAYNPQLIEIWLSSSHVIPDFQYDSSVEIIKYK